MKALYKSASRLLPKVSFTNFHKEQPSSKGAFTRWFFFRKYWSGKIWMLGVRHFQITLDFRKDWIADLTQGAVRSS